MSCAEVTALLELGPLELGPLELDPPELEEGGALEPAEREALRAHLAACAACRERAEQCGWPYETWTTLTEAEMRPLSPDLRARVLERFAAEREAKPAPVPPQADPQAVEAVRRRVALSCSFCHDRCAREDVVYCAECLGPHHLECFRAHGRCCLPGCETTRFVRPQEASPAAPATTAAPGRGLLVRLAMSLSAAAALSGVAALSMWTTGRAAGGAGRPRPAPVPAVEVGEQQDEHAHAGGDDHRDASRAQVIQVEARSETLGPVVDRLAADAGVTVLVEPALRARPITLTARGPWRETLRFLALDVGATVDVLSQGVLLVWTPPSATLRLGRVPLGRALEALADQAQGNVLVDPRLRDVQVTADVQRRDWRIALQELASAADGYLTWIDETALVTQDRLTQTDLEPLYAARRAHPGPPFESTLSGPLLPIARLLGARLEAETGQRLVLDLDEERREVAADLRGVPLREALRGLSRVSGCALEERDPDQLWLRPRGSRVLRAEGCAAQWWFQLLGIAAGRDVTVGPSIRLSPVHATLRDVGPEQALRLTALVHGFEVQEVGTSLIVQEHRTWARGPEPRTPVEAAEASLDQVERLSGEVRQALSRGERARARAASRALRAQLERLRLGGSEAAPAAEATRAALAGSEPELLFQLHLSATAVNRGHTGLAVLEGNLHGPATQVRERNGDPIAGLRLLAIGDGQARLQFRDRPSFGLALGE